MNNQSKTWYISGKLSDTICIILCPLIALVITALVCQPRGTNYVYSSLTPFWFVVGVSILTHAHVLLVFTRSHLNKEIFQRFKYRFTIIPLVLFIAMCVSHSLFLVMGVVGVYWDEIHSIMQTFGFGRIYDSKMKNDALIGRRLDMGMAFVVGLLPNIILLTYLPHTQVDGAFAEYLAMPIAWIKQYENVITAARYPLYSFGILYTLFYIGYYIKLIKNGYKYSKAKMALFFVTGATTVVVASTYTIADGVFFGNIYHALQYIFIVLVNEKSNIAKYGDKDIEVEKNNNYKGGVIIYFLLIIPIVFIFAGLRQMTEGIEYVAAFWLLTSLMHFWFDGFIWSVRRKDIS